MLKTTLQVKEGFGTFTMEGNELPALRAVAEFANGLTFGKTQNFQYQSNTLEVGSMVTKGRLEDAIRFFHDVPTADKINCIKLVRHLTGWGLKEAKEFVEAVTRYHNTTELLKWKETPNQQ